MAGVRAGQRTSALVVAFAAALAAIAVFWNLSRHTPHRAAAPIAGVGVEAAEPPTPAPETEPAPAVVPPAANEESEPADTARNRSTIGRVIKDGRPYLKACYQRALSRDDKLVQGDVTVHVSIAASGKVTGVSMRGPAAFRVLEPCLERTISRWDFPAESAPYTAEFPVEFRGVE
jgi:outer membrane biosynthesis protein TonB